MRGLVFVVVLACGGVALAAPAVPELIEEADILRVDLAQARVDLAVRALEDAVAVLRARYHLGDADGVDHKTREIKRAPKPEPKPTPKK